MSYRVELDRGEGRAQTEESFTVTWELAGVPHAARQAHVVTVEEGVIVRQHAWCGGRWGAPLLAEMAAAQ